MSRNDEIVFRDVSYFESIVPMDVAEQGVTLKVEARGYKTWQQGYSIHFNTSKWMEFPIEIARVEFR